MKKRAWVTYANPETQRRCCSAKHLEFHPIKSFAEGGAFSTENITLRCRAHITLQAKTDGLYLRFPKKKFRRTA